MDLVLRSIGFLFLLAYGALFLGHLARLSMRPIPGKPSWPVGVMGGAFLLALPGFWYLDALPLWALIGLVLLPLGVVMWLTPAVVNLKMPIRSRLWLPVISLGWLGIDINLNYTERLIAKSLRSLGWRESPVWYDVWRWLPQALAVLMVAWLCLDAAIFIWREAKPRSSTERPALAREN